MGELFGENHWSAYYYYYYIVCFALSYSLCLYKFFKIHIYSFFDFCLFLAKHYLNKSYQQQQQTTRLNC